MHNELSPQVAVAANNSSVTDVPGCYLICPGSPDGDLYSSSRSSPFFKPRESG